MHAGGGRVVCFRSGSACRTRLPCQDRALYLLASIFRLHPGQVSRLKLPSAWVDQIGAGYTRKQVEAQRHALQKLAESALADFVSGDFCRTLQRFKLLSGALSFHFHLYYRVETEHRDTHAVGVCAAACYKYGEPAFSCGNGVCITLYRLSTRFTLLPSLLSCLVRAPRV